VGRFLFSANLIIVLVFLPLLTLGGLEGAMFRPTAFAVAAALLGALLLNLCLQPVLASIFLKGVSAKKGKALIHRSMLRVYEFLLRGCFRFRGIIVISFLALILAAGYAFTFLGREFVPPLDEGAIMASTVMLPETSLEESIKMGQRVEQIFLSFPEVVSVSRTTGTAEASEHVHPVNHTHLRQFGRYRWLETRMVTGLVLSRRPKCSATDISLNLFISNTQLDYIESECSDNIELLCSYATKPSVDTPIYRSWRAAGRGKRSVSESWPDWAGWIDCRSPGL
jgi:hypothetical protein